MALYGVVPIIDDDQTDRVGIRTVMWSQMWQASRWPMSQAELDAEKPAPPNVGPGMLFIGEQTRMSGGVMRTAWTYEGVNGDGKSVTFKTRDNTLDFGFEPGFAQVDLLLHPKIQKFLDEGGGSVIDGEIIWPSTITSDAISTGLAGAAGEEKPNPFFGRKDFLRIEGTYRARYCAFNQGNIENLVGRIFSTSSLPGEAPQIGDRNWMHAGAVIARRGPVYDITEIFWLSGPGGWPKEIYGAASQK